MKRFLRIIYNAFLIMIVFSNTVFAINFGTEVTGPLQEVITVLLVVAAGVCVGKVIHIGILYVMSSAVDKSNAKMAILPWVIGTFLCFGAAVIGPAIIDIFRVSSNVLDY